MKKTFAASICIAAVVVAVFCVGTEARYYDHMEPAPMPCYNCGGSGVCPTCDGRGEIVFERWEDDHIVHDMFTCNDCYGNGQCQICYGSGML